MTPITKLSAALAVLFTLSLPACEGDPAPGGPFVGSEFSTEVSEREGSLASVCADFCAHQSTCGEADAACSDDCNHGDVAWQYSALPEVDEPVPETCAETYTAAIDCLATPACDEMAVACEAEVDVYVDCKLDAVSEG